ncbi:MAG: transcription antitermination factor NusB [Myxococcota bacterium]|jgi:16S rRNA (cytosine967-C5)-methyltransferase|nr:transcription antitermination factor NusB [Myxococcota bacterium]
MSGKPRTQSSSPHLLALHVLERTEQDAAFARPLLDTTFRRTVGLAPAERGLVTRLVRGTLQWRLQLDWYLASQLPRGLAHTDLRIRWVLRLGLFGLLHEEGQPSAIVVDRAVRLAKEAGRASLAGLVNAVLRRLAERVAGGSLPLPDPVRDPVGHLAIAAALPDWLARRWLAELGFAEALQLGLSLNEPPSLTVRVAAPTTRDEARAALAQRGILARPAHQAPDALVLEDGALVAELEEAVGGALFVQDEASILVGHLVHPEPGWTVLDACAAPGGKAAHLAGLLGGQGEVHARDAGAGRLRLLTAASRRVPLHVSQRDLLEPPDPKDIARFDAVLLDAPCSNLGTLRRHPEAKVRLAESAIVECASRQRRLLDAAAPLVRPGGVLVYSVCSVAPEEGWAVVDPFLAGEAGALFSVEAPPAPALFSGLLDARGALRTWPHRHGMDGFFAVRLRRK